MKKKSPILMLLVTIVFAGAQYFGYSPDMQAASTISDSVGQAAGALTTRNYFLLGSVLMTAAIFLYDYWKDLKAGGTAVVIFFLSMSTISTASASPWSPGSVLSIDWLLFSDMPGVVSNLRCYSIEPSFSVVLDQSPFDTVSVTGSAYAIFAYTCFPANPPTHLYLRE